MRNRRFYSLNACVIQKTAPSQERANYHRSCYPKNFDQLRMKNTNNNNTQRHEIINDHNVMLALQFVYCYGKGQQSISTKYLLVPSVQLTVNMYAICITLHQNSPPACRVRIYLSVQLWRAQLVVLFQLSRDKQSPLTLKMYFVCNRHKISCRVQTGPFG